METKDEFLNFGKLQQQKLARLSSKALASMERNDLHQIDKTIAALLAIFKKKRFFRKNAMEAKVAELSGHLEVAYLNVLNNIYELESVHQEACQTYEALKNHLEEMKKFETDFAGDMLYDLELSSAVILQTISQVEAIITGDKALLRKIQSILQHTIPTWKNSLLGEHQVADELENALQKIKESQQAHETIRKEETY